jgi:hypothetical protein
MPAKFLYIPKFAVFFRRPANTHKTCIRIANRRQVVNSVPLIVIETRAKNYNFTYFLTPWIIFVDVSLLDAWAPQRDDG